jgi:hypothetical protein
MIDRIRAVSHNSKPFGITEYCSVTNGGGVTGKNQWLDDLFEVVEEKEVKMLVYFNLDKNEGASGSLKDWMIFGGVNGDETFDYEGRSFKAYSAYRENVAKSYIKGSDMSLTNRWISDDYFYGTADDVPAASSSSAPAISKTHAASISKSKFPVPSSSRDPSSSSTPEAPPAASSSSPKAPAASSSSSPDAPAASFPSSPEAPASSSSSPVPNKTTYIYCDNIKLSNVTKIGSRTVLYVNKLDRSAPEGTKVLQATVTRQEGGLLIKRETTLDISDFHYLQFHLRSSSFGTLVKVSSFFSPSFPFLPFSI